MVDRRTPVEADLMAEFATQDGTIYYEVLGPEDESDNGKDARWLTLLHNFMSTGRAAWGTMVDRLAQTYRILLPDAPGHGRSTGYPQAFNHTEMARQLAMLISEVGADRGHLAGCSSGGMLAQLMVQHELVDPASLTLVSTTYSVNPETTGNTASLQPESFRFGKNWLQGTARLHDPYQGDSYFTDVLLPNFRRLTPITAIDLSLSDLARWRMPVCLIQGDEDEFFPPFIPKQMAEALPHAELHLIAGQSHALIFRQAWKVRDIMVDFLAKHS